MTVISKGAVLKKKVGSDVYIYQPYTHIDFVEGGLDQAEIENLINSAGYLDAPAVNAILESYYTKDEVDIAINNQCALKTRISVTSLGLDNSCTIGDICEALPNYSMLITGLTKGEYPNIELPTDGTITVKKDSGVGSVELLLNTHNGVYRANYSNWKTPQFSGWDKVILLSEVYTKAEVDNLIASLASNAMWRGNAPS